MTHTTEQLEQMLAALADDRDLLATAHKQLMQSLDAANARADQARVAQQWAKLYHYLPRYGLSTALAHLRLSPERSLAQVMYALKYRVNAHLGRLPNG